ncbi:MAG: DUF87 domain-containing protein [Lachnospiraceae bacterium]|nr:DUF87 domain-containing protein [Ruminococcus sp.]MCM1274518.1 DUF87 domain-containing protein [Lachnospiraceae bacterium]
MAHDKTEFSEAYLSDQNIMYLCSDNKLEFKNQSDSILPMDMCLFGIDEVSFEDQAPRRAALENILSALRIEGVNFIFLILGDKNGVHFYYGVSKDETNDFNMKLSIADIGTKILKPSIQGNFRGSKINTLTPDETNNIVNKISNMKYSGMLEGVPGANKDDEKFQGVDRLVDVMLGDEFGFMVIAKPLNQETVLDIQSNMYSLYSKLVPMSKRSKQSGTSSSTGRNSSVSVGESTSNGTSDSRAETKGTSESNGTSNSSEKGKNFSKSESSSKNTSCSTSTGENESKSAGTSTNTGTSHSVAETKGTNVSHSENKSTSEGKSDGTSTSETIGVEYVNRELQDWIKYFDDIFFPRLDYGKGKGVFVTAIAMFTNNNLCMTKLQNTAVSLYAGETGNRVPLKAVTPLPKKCEKALKNLRMPYGKLKKGSDADEHLAYLAMSQVIDKDGNAYIGNWITTNELGLVAGLPQKEVVGLCLKEEVEFGLNAHQIISDENRIELGNLVQSGNVLPNNPVYLDKSVLDQHIFIAGVTGSGKTTTCQEILLASGVHFIVVEPAKTEYRILKENYDDLLVFTLGKNDIAPFKLNPFSFFPHESITSRVDMIKASIESAFDMEAAIPQIIEAALYRSYEEYGWNIATNKNSKFKDPFDPGVNAFPTLEDLLRNTTKVTREQGFDDRLRDEYIGSINARLQGLLVGNKGFMLNTHHSMDFEELLEHNVVLELEEIRSGTEKALIMGFILTNLAEAIKAKYKRDGKFKHIILVEEAHRLLSKYQPGDDPNKRHAVDMFADMLAEIRKYGESLIIVDQIPNKLTPEVLKNTNTKIIHRLFAADDKDAIGNTMMLNKDQKEFLSNLEAGRAIYFTTGVDKAIQIQIKQSSDTAKKTPDDSELIPMVREYYKRHFKEGMILGTELLDSEPDNEQFDCIFSLGLNGNVESFFAGINSAKADEPLFSAEDKNALLKAAGLLGIDFLVMYVRKYVADNYLIGDAKDDGVLREALNELLYNDISSSRKRQIKDMWQPKPNG